MQILNLEHGINLESRKGSQGPRERRRKLSFVAMKSPVLMVRFRWRVYKFKEKVDTTGNVRTEKLWKRLRRQELVKRCCNWMSRQRRRKHLGKKKKRQHRGIILIESSPNVFVNTNNNNNKK